MAEHSTADREVTGSTPVVPLYAFMLDEPLVRLRGVENGILTTFFLQGGDGRIALENWE